MTEQLVCSVVVAMPGLQRVWTVELVAGATVAEAIEAARCKALAEPAGVARFSGVDWAKGPVGSFGKLRRREERLQANDRIEFYRPLAADPKDHRRQRAQDQRRRNAPRARP